MKCAGCQSPFEPRRAGQLCCSAKCRAAASRKRKRGMPAVVRSVRYLKSGTVQIIIHVPPIWADVAHVRIKGGLFNLVGNEGRG